jgi:hypothetical protein
VTVADMEDYVPDVFLSGNNTVKKKERKEKFYSCGACMRFVKHPKKQKELKKVRYKDKKVEPYDFSPSEELGSP